jgi:outer membrane protein
MKLNTLGALVALVVVSLGFESCSSANDAPKEQTPVTTPETVATANSNKSGKLGIVALVNSDTILANYDLATQLRDQLTEQSLKYENVLRQKENSLRIDLEKLQADAPKLSQFEGQTRQRKLYEDQEKLQQMQEEYSRKLLLLEQDYNREIDAAINTFLEEYCADKPYEMVLSNSELGIIRWADKSLDITQPVLEGLNKAYRENQEQSETK